jgi:hypothetical protein
MNWGNKIAIIFTLFVIGVITMVTISMKQDFYLVADNYYEEEIAYQDKIEKIKNGTQWSDSISIAVDGDQLAIKFDKAEQVDGKIIFFRPSNANLDFELPLVAELTIPTTKFEKGLWKVSLEWQQNDRQFVKETKITIP